MWAIMFAPSIDILLMLTELIEETVNATVASQAGDASTVSVGI